MDLDKAGRKLGLLEKRVCDLRERYAPRHGSSFYHLTGNLLFSLSGTINFLLKMPRCEHKGFERGLIRDYASLYRYVSWLEEDKDFRDAEMGSMHGYLGERGFSEDAVLALQGKPCDYVYRALKTLLQCTKYGF